MVQSTRFNREIVSFEEAARRIAPHARPLEREWIPLASSDGRRLGEDVAAAHDVPHFRRSMMDGFAILTRDTVGCSTDETAVLEVIDHIACGMLSSRELEPGTAARIMTGAQLPDAANAVVKLEAVEAWQTADGRAFIRLHKPARPGDNVAAVGRELHAGDALLAAGSRVNAGTAALLAMFGHAQVSVYRKPRVAVLSTGTELLRVDEPLAPGKIRDSNASMLAALVRDAGGVATVIDAVPDDAVRARSLLAAAFAEHDAVITSGGVSVGDHDILVDILAEGAAEVLFNKVAMRPGSPTTVAVWDDKLLFALSGNPGACFVGFELFVRPALWAMQGHALEGLVRRGYKAFLGEDIPPMDSFTRLIRGVGSVEDGRFLVQSAGLDQSGVTRTIKDTTVLMVIPPTGGGRSEGDLVTVIPVGETE